MSQLLLLPFSFWIALAALVTFLIKSWLQPESSIRLPMIVVLLTISVWYFGDVIYNDYADYMMEIDSISLHHAWWEVTLFIITFGLAAPRIHRSFNRKYLGKPSNLLSLVAYGGLKSDEFQDQVDAICRFLLALWIVMMIIALFRTSFDFIGIFMPYLGTKADPWGRGRLGTGLDPLIAAAGYFQIALTAGFGVIAALAFRASSLGTALLVWFLTLPSYIFDRTRSTILATVLPGFLAFVFLRLRSGIVVKLAILAVGFLVMEGWLKFVIENRGEVSIAEAFHQGIHLQSDNPEGVKHLGLNMFEELGFINMYIADGSYRPNWGQRYFAELANPIPRTLWPGKPMIGIDYAIARGQKLDADTDDATGVGATISTGMIGQGVVNFGRILGPMAAATIMAFWVAILARQDLLAADAGRLFLYSIGLILTFNSGRDITLLVLYPFFFSYILLLVTKKWSAAQNYRQFVTRWATAVRMVSQPAPNPPRLRK